MLCFSFSCFTFTPEQRADGLLEWLCQTAAESPVKVLKDLPSLGQDGSKCLLHANDKASTVVLGLNVPCGDTESSET